MSTNNSDERSSVRKIAAWFGKYLRNVSKGSFAVFADAGGAFTFDEKPRSESPNQGPTEDEVK